MTFSFSFNFENTDDLLKFLNVLKERGFDKFIRKTKQAKTIPIKKREWKHIGIGNLKGNMDTVNIRDYAYED
jgi:hypothetical protein